MTGSGQDGASATYVCRCEEVTADEVRTAVAAGAADVNDVKRRTRAGMGACQGVYCVGPIADLVAAGRGVARAEVEPMTARAPVRPVPLAALAGMETED